MLRKHTELKDAHRNSDIWVIGSGPSLNFINKSFFRGKITIGINRVGYGLPLMYTIVKDLTSDFDVSCFQGKPKIVVSKYKLGSHTLGYNEPDFPCYIFDQVSLRNTPSTEVIGTDKLIVSNSTFTSGIHLACYMGAKNVMLVGHDCGTINGDLNVKGYYDTVRPVQESDEEYRKFITKKIEKETIMVKHSLQGYYNVNIHSLNPFINFNLEGNTYEK